MAYVDRTKRVKDARSEAQKEIEDYRGQKENEFKDFEKQVRNASHRDKPVNTHLIRYTAHIRQQTS